MWAGWRPDANAILRDQKARASLARYFDIMLDKVPAKYSIAKKLPVDFDRKDSISQLWRIHDRLIQRFYMLEMEIDSRRKKLEELEPPKKSFLDLKVELAQRLLSNCLLCTRKCGAKRSEGEVGYCHCGIRIIVSSMFQHMGEEPELVPSGTIFTIGCNMRCFHCQNWTISQCKEKGEAYTVESLAKAVEKLRESGCRNANLVGGEPTPWLEQWLETFRKVRVNVPVIWNSNSYFSQETAKLLAGFADLYLLDFKYGPGECAERISDAPGYWNACTRNHLCAQKYGELLVRVLVLPGHNDCCTRPILEWVAKNVGTETRLNLMDQYRPAWRAYEAPILCRRLSHTEFDEAVQIAKSVGLNNFIV